MSIDANHDQELMLKKRARRRLVGAIALVILMIVMLPQILQDRAITPQQEPIKITMSEPSGDTLSSAIDTHSKATASLDPIQPEPITNTETLQHADSASGQNSSSDIATSQVSTVTPSTKEQTVNSAQATTPTEIQNPDSKKTENKTGQNLAVQIGVYADAANAKRIQDQLKQAGFATQTEKIKTAKGESIRLRVGTYSARTEAQLALDKVKGLGLPGIIVSNE